jgi:hypothetical protein
MLFRLFFVDYRFFVLFISPCTKPFIRSDFCKKITAYKWALALNLFVLDFVFEPDRTFLEKKRMGFPSRSTGAKIPECPVIHHPKIGVVTRRKKENVAFGFLEIDRQKN